MSFGDKRTPKGTGERLLVFEVARPAGESCLDRGKDQADPHLGPKDLFQKLFDPSSNRQAYYVEFC